MVWDELLQLVIAAGALGTAAFGIVEGSKWTSVGVWGSVKSERR